MSDKTLPFVITDRRKFTAEGDPRDGVEIAPAPENSAATPESPLEFKPEPEHAGNVVQMPAPDAAPPAETSPIEAMEALAGGHAGQDAGSPGEQSGEGEDGIPPAPTEEQMEQSKRAFDATAERIDLAMRAADPGADHPPALSFESLVQSVYMQAVMQLGGATQPGEQPRVDLLGARQSIDMIGILAEKTKGNLTKSEETLLSSALFELRLAFLEMTQAIARQAAARNPGAGGPGGVGGPAGPGGFGGPSSGPGGPGGPRIVR